MDSHAVSQSVSFSRRDFSVMRVGGAVSRPSPSTHLFSLSALIASFPGAFILPLPTRRRYSELEGQAGHLLVLLLRELVFEGGEELGVDLEHEALHILHHRL
mmetsp:Transcript_9558/g.11313  ORF Transcript_9558/g.11313 Transcript_9558/m.11313 type:complete len:102 (-) Transcript_9558:1188-1493(-)